MGGRPDIAVAAWIPDTLRNVLSTRWYISPRVGEIDVIENVTRRERSNPASTAMRF